MTAELKRLANDPNYVVQFAVGDPSPTFRPQRRDSGLTITGVYFDDTKRYLLKSAHLSLDDMRVFDVDTGHVVLVSHHPGKNPYEALDPLGLADTDSGFNVAGGEWESMCDVTAMTDEFTSLKIRPKLISRHGRQTVATAHDDAVVMNIGKLSKLKTKSLRDQFMVGQEESKTLCYKCVADFVGRSIQVFNDDDELVAQVAKTTKAMLLTAAFGKGSESTIDIAAGVDCSIILAIVFGLKQVGKHFMNDAFGNYVKDPITDMATGAVVDAAVDGITGGDDEQEEPAEEAEEEPEEEAEGEAEEEPEEEAEEQEGEEEGSTDDEEDGGGGGGFVETSPSLFSSFFGGGYRYEEECEAEEGGGEEEEYGAGEEYEAEEYEAEEDYEDDGGGDDE